MTRLFHYAAFAILMMLLLATAHAATVWTDQVGYYIKQKSASGKVRYVTMKPEDVRSCLTSANWRCDDQYGLVFDLDKSRNGCYRVAINKRDFTELQFYSGYHFADDGKVVCDATR